MRVLCLFFPRLSLQLAARQRPDLESRPLVTIAGAGDESLVAAASTDAAARGVVAGMTPAQARVRCPNATFFPDNAGACLDELERIASILRRRATGIVAIVSREELLLDVSSIPGARDEDEADLARRVTSVVRMWTDLTVRAAVASSRTEAREAARGARLATVVRPPVLAWHEPVEIRGVSVGPLAVEVSLPLGTSPLAARARLQRASRRLQTILDATGASYREVRAIVVRGGVARQMRMLVEPAEDVAAALESAASWLGDDVLATAESIRLELDRLGPSVRVDPAMAVLRRAG